MDRTATFTDYSRANEKIQTPAPQQKPSDYSLLLILPARTIFILLAQCIVALCYYLQDYSTPWQSSEKWWTVWGSIADIGCLVLLFASKKKEGLSLRDMIGKVSFKTPFTGLLYFLVVVPFVAAGSFIGSLLAYDSWHPDIPAGGLFERHLPLLGVLYSIILWAPIWSATEEMFYNGYPTPRLRSVFKKKWLAVTLICFWWALQHSFLPLIPSWHYIAWRFVVFVPCVLALNLVYLRTRKLAPLIVAHWLLDMVAAATTLAFTHHG